MNNEAVSVHPAELPKYMKNLIEKAEKSILLADNSLPVDLFPSDTCAALRNAVVRGIGLLCVSGRYVEGKQQGFKRRNPVVSMMDEVLRCEGLDVPALLQFYQYSHPLAEGVAVRDGKETLTYKWDMSGACEPCYLSTSGNTVSSLSRRIFEVAAAIDTDIPISPKDYVCSPRHKVLEYYVLLPASESVPTGGDATKIERLFDSFVRQRQELMDTYWTPKEAGSVDWDEVQRWVDDSLMLDEEYFDLVKAKLLGGHRGKYAAISFGRLLGVAESESNLFDRVRAVYPKAGLYVNQILPESERGEIIGSLMVSSCQ